MSSHGKMVRERPDDYDVETFEDWDQIRMPCELLVDYDRDYGHRRGMCSWQRSPEDDSDWIRCEIAGHEITPHEAISVMMTLASYVSQLPLMHPDRYELEGEAQREGRAAGYTDAMRKVIGGHIFEAMKHQLIRNRLPTTAPFDSIRATVGELTGWHVDKARDLLTLHKEQPEITGHRHRKGSPNLGGCC